MRVPGTVLVTGASSGIGEATALRLDRSGWQVLAGVRREEDAQTLREKASTRLEPLLLDVTEPDTIAAAVRLLGDRELDALVNNAGIALGGPIEHVPLEDLRHQFEVNVFGLVAVTQAMLPALRRATGRVVNVGSVGGRVASAFIGPYTASKFAVESLTDSLRAELQPWGLHVSVVEPGAVATPIWAKGAAHVEQARARMLPVALAHYGKAMGAFEEQTRRLDARGIPAQRVAAVIERALTSARPRTRYLVGVDARVQVALTAVLPDRVWDALLARLMKTR
jgi:NAD(P)-dependent dehydrogenase (short-subunit alcohol dehydrogenase family)